MDRRERLNDPEEQQRAAMQGALYGVWTALPGIINSVDLTAQTCTVQPSIQGQQQAPDSTWSNVNLPLLLDCPLIFPSGGGYSLTFPVSAGDECLVVFSSRCIDAWWQSGGVQPPAEMRMHDLSDGFAIVGPRSQPRKLSAVSEDTVQLRNDSGTEYVELDGAGVISIVAPVKIVLQSPLVECSGAITAASSIGAGTSVSAGTVITAVTSISAPTVTGTTDVIFGTKSAGTHKHGGVQVGGGQTGVPV